MSAVPHAATGITVKTPDAFFIGGKWEKPSAKNKLDVISPVTEQVVMRFAEAAPADVDKAVAAARRAFDTGPWPRMSAQERGKALLKVAELLKARLPELATTWTTQVGAPISLTRYLSAQPSQLFEYYGTLIQSYPLVDERRGGGQTGKAVAESAELERAVARSKRSQRRTNRGHELAPDSTLAPQYAAALRRQAVVTAAALACALHPAAGDQTALL